jgi:antirestriction protein ArdC
MAELDAGRVPWVQPWGTAAAKTPLAMPENATTGPQYSGINVLIKGARTCRKHLFGTPPFRIPR